MNQNLIGALRAIGYPVLFAGFAALITAIPGASQYLPIWLPAGVLTIMLGMIEHQLAIVLGYNVPSNS